MLPVAQSCASYLRSPADGSHLALDGAQRLERVFEDSGRAGGALPWTTSTSHKQDRRVRTARRRPGRRRNQASRPRAADQRARFPRVRAGGVGHVLPGHARSRAEPARDSAGARRAPSGAADVRAAASCASLRRRNSCSSWPSTRPAAPDARRSSRPICSQAIFEESQGVPVSIIRRHGVEPDVLGVAHRHPHARQRAARGAAAQAVRAAAVPEALRDQPEPAGAPGQDRRRYTGATTRSSRCSRSSATASGRTR